jgi:hypothetical protein
VLIPAQCSSAHIAAIEKRPSEGQQRAVCEDNWPCSHMKRQGKGDLSSPASALTGEFDPTL